MKKKKEKLGENLQKNSWKESLFKIFVNDKICQLRQNVLQIKPLHILGLT
jgi:hypothetical protein